MCGLQSDRLDKPIGFFGQPDSPRGLPASLCPARLCALAWARSNFPSGAAPEIHHAERDGTVLRAVLVEQQEVVTFHFDTVMDAQRAFNHLPAASGVQGSFALAADVDRAALEREMNFGGGAQTVDDVPRAPAQGLHFE